MIEVLRKSQVGKIDWYLVAFVFGCSLLSFLSGGFLGINDQQPFRTFWKHIELAVEASEQLVEQRPAILTKKRHATAGVNSYSPGQSLNGKLLMQGWFSDGAQIRLVSYTGEIEHQWFVNFFEIWPEPSHITPATRIPNSRFNFHTQGFVMQPDGSVVVEIADLGAAKLDLCSNVIWTVNRSVHHVIKSDDKGGYWMAGHRDFDKIPKHLLFGSVTRAKLSRANGRYENMLLHVNSKGEVIKEISMLEALKKVEFEHKIYDVLKIKSTDPTHINDIELVPEILAQKLDGVNPGDLLVSIRQMHMLVIINPDTGEIVWTQTGPWVRQHDPDITPDGKILVFNNGGGPNLGFSEIPGSNIVEFEPSNRSWSIFLPRNQSVTFHTDIMGNHQALPNGNHLVTESRAGRVLQFAADGQLMWEYIAEYNDEYAALIEIAEWIPEDFFQVDNWSCP